MFMDLTVQSVTALTDTGKRVSFVSTTVQQTSQVLNNWINPSSAIDAGDYYVTTLPSEIKLKDYTDLSNCDANFECWSFKDGNVAIFVPKNAQTDVQSNIANIDTFYHVLKSDLSIVSDVWQNKLYTHIREQQFLAYDGSNTFEDIEDLTGALTDTELISLNGADAVIAGGDLDILVKFQTASEIPSTGAIYILKNADYNSFYPDCRSFVTKSANPSVLYNDILDATKKSGSVYCKNEASGWFLTIFY